MAPTSAGGVPTHFPLLVSTHQRCRRMSKGQVACEAQSHFNEYQVWHADIAPNFRFAVAPEVIQIARTVANERARWSAMESNRCAAQPFRTKHMIPIEGPQRDTGFFQ